MTEYKYRVESKNSRLGKWAVIGEYDHKQGAEGRIHEELSRISSIYYDSGTTFRVSIRKGMLDSGTTFRVSRVEVKAKKW